MRFLYGLIYLVFFFITIIGFNESLCSFNFSNGSDSVMDLSVSNIWIKVLLIVILGMLLLKYLQKKNYKFLSLIFIILPIWILSGRTVGIFPDGRLNIGWFYIKTDRINLCHPNDDCEKIFYNNTKIEELPFWRIKIENKNINQIIFVGPFIWNQTRKMFETKYYKPN